MCWGRQYHPLSLYDPTMPNPRKTLVMGHSILFPVFASSIQSSQCIGPVVE